MKMENTPPTLEEIQAVYPGVADAIALHERPDCDIWDVARLSGYSPTKIVRGMIEMIDETLAEFDGPGRDELEIARSQMEHPNFLAYVKAKLGAM